MKYRTIPGTRLKVSEIGFGVWTLLTGPANHFNDTKARHLLQYALDRGINFFDTAADIEGEGRGESLIGDTFVGERERIVIATKFGYEALPQSTETKEERPQDFSPKHVRLACIESLKRLRTDHIDLYQMHHPKVSAIEQDDLYEVLSKLQKEGKIVTWGAALGPGAGWIEEAKLLIRLKKTRCLQIIHNLLEQDSARAIKEDAKKFDAGLVIRNPHAAGRLSGAREKIENFEFLIQPGLRTLAQAALKFILSERAVVSVLPDIYGEEEINEFVSVSECPDLTAEELKKTIEIYEHHFYSDPAQPVPKLS